ncbi:hypothetical protein BC628DRAFT_421463 [Trametes gibbosa]|nr:hypothetical protein BC628DRAFT_421463 [Trametes gibbosa]
MSIMSLTVPNSRSVFSEHCTRPSSEGDVQSCPQMVCSPTPLPQTPPPQIPLPQAPPRDTSLPPSPPPQTELPQERLPETPPSPISSRACEASLDPRRECRAARRDVLCQYSRQSYEASVASPCTYEGFPPLPLARHRIRFKELIEELARMMDEAAPVTRVMTKSRSDYFHLPRSIIPPMLYRFLILLVPISSWAPSRRSITLLHMYSYSTPLMLCRTMSRFQHVFES